MRERERHREKDSIVCMSRGTEGRLPVHLCVSNLLTQFGRSGVHSRVSPIFLSVMTRILVWFLQAAGRLFGSRCAQTIACPSHPTSSILPASSNLFFCRSFFYVSIHQPWLFTDLILLLFSLKTKAIFLEASYFLMLKDSYKLYYQENIRRNYTRHMFCCCWGDYCRNKNLRSDFVLTTPSYSVTVLHIGQGRTFKSGT